MRRRFLLHHHTRGCPASRVFTESPPRPRLTIFSKPQRFSRTSGLCPLLSRKRGHNKFPLEQTWVGSRYGGGALLSACLIVLRDNSCLYLWQANRLIKGGHVCFLCLIPSPEQTLPYLCSAALAASTFPSPPRRGGPGTLWERELD